MKVGFTTVYAHKFAGGIYYFWKMSSTFNELKNVPRFFSLIAWAMGYATNFLSHDPLADQSAIIVLSPLTDYTICGLGAHLCFKTTFVPILYHCQQWSNNCLIYCIATTIYIGQQWCKQFILGSSGVRDWLPCPWTSRSQPFNSPTNIGSFHKFSTKSSDKTWREETSRIIKFRDATSCYPEDRWNRFGSLIKYSEAEKFNSNIGEFEIILETA
jgi:hypothetical protein